MRNITSSDIPMFNNYVTIGAPFDEVKKKFMDCHAFEMQFEFNKMRTRLCYMTPWEPHNRALLELHCDTGWYINNEYETADGQNQRTIHIEDGDYCFLDCHAVPVDDWPDDEAQTLTVERL